MTTLGHGLFTARRLMPLFLAAVLISACGHALSISSAPSLPQPQPGGALLEPRSAIAPENQGDVSYHHGPTLKTAKSIAIYVNSKTSPPDKYWDYPGKFIDRFSQSKMDHIADEYVQAKQNDRYPYLKGVVVKHKGGMWTDLDINAILTDAVNQTHASGYGYIYHVFMVNGQELCTKSFCIPKDACAGHGYADLKVGKAKEHILYTVQPFATGNCTAPSGKFADSEAEDLVTMLLGTITDPDFDGWYYVKGANHYEIDQLCNNAWGDIVMNPGNVSYNVTQDWLNSVHTCAYAPFGLVTIYQVGQSGAGMGGIAGGSDGNVWFTYYGGSAGKKEIGRITPKGAVTFFPVSLPGSAGLLGITAGPDGNLWFLVDNYVNSTFQGAIGRITTRGDITIFTNGLSAQPPVEIAPGNDGNVWFTQYSSQYPEVGKITPSGHITEYKVKATYPNLRGITAGPDGNEWFDASLSNFVANITPHGTVTQYTLWSGANPYGIATGADENVWFTYAGGIARMTTDGKYHKFPVGVGNVTGYAFAQGPDGALYFSTGSPAAIGRMTTMGDTTLLAKGLEKYAYLYRVTASLDGNIWFLDTGDHVIGKMSLSEGP